ncbi:DUF2303 family protein [Rodentibacter haemolyticus]|uniref:DUF2303 family protein n=1 Tax=Rodentibacter haemolyticus TaxID=2778911 RepID=A0ABX6UXU7_9PAST|nr:DUF2303 family protein [Rodentibacter haemolyticus]QPB42183.1 DUF2303 family protein [Rodentibacter haemolyticus]
MEQSLVNDIAKNVANGKSLNTPIPAVLAAGDFDIRSLEEYQSAPARIRQHIFLRTEQSLIDYVNKFKQSGTAIFANLDDLEIKAVFDYHANPEKPNWGDHSATYNCPYSKDWKEWARKDKQAMSQVEFGAFLENNIHSIATDGNIVSGAELLAMVLAFEETRKSEFKSVKRLQDGTMSFTFTDEQTGGGKARLPEEIVLGIQPFHNGDFYQLKARVRYRIKDGSLALWYELINPEKVVEDAFNTTLDKLKANIADVDFYEAQLN